MDFLRFLFTQFANLISFLDSFELIEGLSILRILIIVFIFNVALDFLLSNKKGND